MQFTLCYLVQRYKFFQRNSIAIVIHGIGKGFPVSLLFQHCVNIINNRTLKAFFHAVCHFIVRVFRLSD